MKLLISLCAISAMAYAATVDLLVTKDLLSNPANGGPSTYHYTDKYTISCCSASNPSYLFTAYDISSLAGKDIVSAQLYVSALSNTPPQRVSEADNSKNPNVQFYTATDFSETPTTDLSKFPTFEQDIQTIYLNKEAVKSIDVTGFVQNASSSNDNFFNIGWNPTGGMGASVTVAAREANPRSSYLRVVYDNEESAEPTTVSPFTTVAACPTCPCGEVNLSGDNNASPARRFRRNSACPTCKVCPTTSAPSTVAPTTLAPTQAPTTSSPPVQLSPVPTTLAPCPPCPCGEANLSGDNNASPARRIRGSCPVCKACPTTYAPSTMAPTTLAPTTSAPSTKVPTTSSPTTSAPPVQVSPRPTCPICPCGETNLSGDNNASPARNGPNNSCPTCKACPTTKTPSQNESGQDNAKAASSAAHITAFSGLIIAAIVAFML